MNGPRFDQTVRGARFFDHDMPRVLALLPKLVRELERFNDNVERLHAVLDAARPTDGESR